MKTETISIQTEGRGSYDITRQVAKIAAEAGVGEGICHLFVQHTSASLMICENADPTVRRDLEAFFARLVPDGDPLFSHVSEGPDDMPAHVRSILTHTDLTVPVRGGRCALGTWQGIYLLEHRARPHQRRVLITVW